VRTKSKGKVDIQGGDVIFHPRVSQYIKQQTDLLETHTIVFAFRKIG
jgi:hypothetical protein